MHSFKRSLLHCPTVLFGGTLSCSLEFESPLYLTISKCTIYSFIAHSLYSYSWHICLPHTVAWPSEDGVTFMEEGTFQTSPLIASMYTTPSHTHKPLTLPKLTSSLFLFSLHIHVVHKHTYNSIPSSEPTYSGWCLPGQLSVGMTDILNTTHSIHVAFLCNSDLENCTPYSLSNSINTNYCSNQY